jgi:tetratricopeptide (TPR) repeat protein
MISRLALCDRCGDYFSMMSVKMNISMALVLASLLTPMHVMGAPPSTLERELEHQARTVYDNGAYIQAIFLLKQALKLDPDNPKLSTNLGSAENEALNYSGALSFYRQTLELDPHHVGALLGIGATLDLLGNHSLALTYFKDVLQQPVPHNSNNIEKLQIDRASHCQADRSNHHATRVIGSLDSVPGVEAWMLIAKIGDMLYSISYTDSYKDLYTTLPTVQEMINSFQGQSK